MAKRPNAAANETRRAWAVALIDGTLNAEPSQPKLNTSAPNPPAGMFCPTRPEYNVVCGFAQNGVPRRALIDKEISAVTSRWDGLLLDCRLATLCETGTAYGAIEHAALGWKEGTIQFCGPQSQLPGKPDTLAARVESLGGAWITPGLIDCHTHLVFAGNRAEEFDLCLNGASYEEIARTGGGIVSTVSKTRAASDDDLFAQSLRRARALLADGATTIEIKSGYGLDLDSEIKMLRTARRIGDELGISVRTTFRSSRH